jgi:probable phosphomutase (TIGR03848 family)
LTYLLLIRHGINDMVGQKKLAGWLPNVHLNDEGRAQAEAVAERLRDVPINAIYSSPLERTIETAEPLARSKNLEIQVREGLGEVRYGDWTGKAIEELAKDQLWRVVQMYPSGMQFPGGDTMRGMQARIVNELEQIAAEHPRQIVAVVTHADLIKAALAHYLGVHFDLFQRIAVEPASVSVVLIDKFRPFVIRINDDGPLKIKIDAEERKPKQPRREHSPLRKPHLRQKQIRRRSRAKTNRLRSVRGTS